LVQNAGNPFTSLDNGILPFWEYLFRELPNEA